MITYVREYECLECHENWVSDVRVALVGEVTNISGEKTEWCPKCGSSNVMGSPYKEKHWRING